MSKVAFSSNSKIEFGPEFGMRELLSSRRGNGSECEDVKYACHITGGEQVTKVNMHTKSAVSRLYTIVRVRVVLGRAVY